VKVRLDNTDWKILAELQQNGRITNVELAKRIGISAPACLRRVRALEKEGLITEYRALLNAPALGYDLTVFAMVSLSSTKDTDILAFEERMKTNSVVRECYLLSGEVDFLLKCTTKDLADFQAFVINELTSLPMVGHVTTALTMRETKNEPAIPIEENRGPDD